jgi:hypothetical protein
MSQAREGETTEHLNRATLTEQQQKWIKLVNSFTRFAQDPRRLAASERLS